MDHKKGNHRTGLKQDRIEKRLVLKKTGLKKDQVETIQDLSEKVWTVQRPVLEDRNVLRLIQDRLKTE